MMFFLPSILLSGFMFPFAGMPGWVDMMITLNELDIAPGELTPEEEKLLENVAKVGAYLQRARSADGLHGDRAAGAQDLALRAEDQLLDRAIVRGNAVDRRGDGGVSVHVQYAS